MILTRPLFGQLSRTDEHIYEQPSVAYPNPERRQGRKVEVEITKWRWRGRHYEETHKLRLARKQTGAHAKLRSIGRPAFQSPEAKPGLCVHMKCGNEIACEAAIGDEPRSARSALRDGRTGSRRKPQ